MCVMDFAFDFRPLDDMNNQNEMKVNMNREDMMNNSDFANNNLQNNPNNQSPLVKLSLDNEDFKGKEMMNQQVQNEVTGMNNQIVAQNNYGGNNEIDSLTKDTINLMNNLKVISKKVEIVTKVTYTYEDGSSKVVTQNETHEFKN